MKRHRKNTAPNDIVYDDDTSSSSDSENLQTFHQTYMCKKTSSSGKYSSSDADDEVNEDTSDEDIDASNHTSSTSSDGETELENDISIRTLNATSKLENLQSKLKSLSKVRTNIEDSKEKSHNEVKKDMLSACIEGNDIDIEKHENSKKDSTPEMSCNQNSQLLPGLCVDKERVRNLLHRKAEYRS